MALPTSPPPTSAAPEVPLHTLQDTLKADSYLLDRGAQHIFQSGRYAAELADTPLELLRCAVPLPGGAWHLCAEHHRVAGSLGQDDCCDIAFDLSHNTYHAAVLSAVPTHSRVAHLLLLLPVSFSDDSEGAECIPQSPAKPISEIRTDGDITDSYPATTDLQSGSASSQPSRISSTARI